MGYTTDFEGEFNLTFNDESKREHVTNLVNGLASTRRMARDLSKISDKLDHPVEYYGVEGEFYYGGGGMMGQDDDNSVLNHNVPSTTQPGLWLQWVIEGDILKWDGSEKFYAYIEWLQYLIDNVFVTNNVVLSGSVDWFGEDRDDTGSLIATDNKVITV